MLVSLVNHVYLCHPKIDVISFLLLLVNLIDHLVLSGVLISIYVTLANSLYHCFNYGFMRNRILKKPSLRVSDTKYVPSNENGDCEIIKMLLKQLCMLRAIRLAKHCHVMSCHVVCHVVCRVSCVCVCVCACVCVCVSLYSRMPKEHFNK